MVTQVQLGNFFSSGGKTILGGVGGSGIDTESMIKTLVEAKRLPATQLEDRITKNSKKSTALTSFKTLLSSLQDAANFLRNPPGVGNAAENVFKFTSSAIVSNSDVPGSLYMGVTASPGAALQSYHVSDIASVAKAKKQKTGSFFIASADTSVVSTAHTPGYFKAGTITVNGANITLNAGDSLNTVVAKFNQQKGTSGIEAAILQIDSGEYVLSFSATATGLDADFDLNDSGTVTDATGVLSMISRTNLILNGTFNTNISGWTDASVGTGTIIHESDDDAMVLDGDGVGNEAFAQQAMATVIGQQYTVRATFAGGPNNASIRIGTDDDVTLPGNSDVGEEIVNADGYVEYTFTATSTTTYLTFNSGDSTDPFTVDDISVVHDATEAVTLTQAASNAEFTVDGVTFIRQSNSISDAIADVTFNLLQATPALTELDITIKADEQIVRNGIVNFVNAYNALKIFAAEQTQLSDSGEFTEDAVLSDNSIFRTTVNNINSQLASIINGISGGNPSRLADIGITFIDLPESDENPATRNILNVNDGILASAISTNLEGVRRVFEFDFVSTDPNLRVFQSSGSLGTASFTLNIDPDTDTYEATYDNGSGPVTIELDATLITGGSGYTLKGQAGTVLEGLTLIYSSTEAATIDVTTTQGIASKIYNTAFNATKTDTGTVSLELQSLQTSDARLTLEIARIDEMVERFRQQLLEKFGALEQAIARVNSLLQSLDAQDQARINS